MPDTEVSASVAFVASPVLFVLASGSTVCPFALSVALAGLLGGVVPASFVSEAGSGVSTVLELSQKKKRPIFKTVSDKK